MLETIVKMIAVISIVPDKIFHNKPILSPSINNFDACIIMMWFKIHRWRPDRTRGEVLKP